jgi:hypothetical protein
VGIPFSIVTIDLPQNFQTVNGMSPLAAGIRSIPYSVLTPLGSTIASVVASKKIALPIRLVLGVVIQITGLALMATLSTNLDYIPATQYGYEAIAGFGSGVVFGILPLLTPFTVDTRDLGKSPVSYPYFIPTRFADLPKPSQQEPPYNSACSAAPSVSPSPPIYLTTG